MRRLLIGIALLAGVLSLVRHFPLAWAASVLPATGAEYSGTIWTGHVQNIPLLGSVSVKGSLAGLRLKTAPGDVTLTGTITPKTVKDLSLSMPVARLPTTDARLAGLSGGFSLRIEEAVIADGMCLSASGRASSDVLAVNRRQFDWAGPTLSGPVDCTEGRLRVQLSGGTGSETVSATILSGLDGFYQSNVRVQTGDIAAGNALILFGFEAGPREDYTLIEQGRWR